MSWVYRFAAYLFRRAIAKAERKEDSIILLIPATLSRKEYETRGARLLIDFFDNIRNTHIFMLRERAEEQGWKNLHDYYLESEQQREEQV